MEKHLYRHGSATVLPCGIMGFSITFKANSWCVFPNKFLHTFMKTGKSWIKPRQKNRLITSSVIYWITFNEQDSKTEQKQGE
jgi:hypothetical protein